VVEEDVIVEGLNAMVLGGGGGVIILGFCWAEDWLVLIEY
jgi:hypothetical protein